MSFATHTVSTVASAGNDVLMGGAGSDLLIGGAGNDDILGDLNWTPTSFNWSVTTDAAGDRIFTPVNSPAPIGGGDDVIYAGEGDDRVNAGIGNDIVFGEGGDILNSVRCAVLFGREKCEAANDASFMQRKKA